MRKLMPIAAALLLVSCAAQKDAFDSNKAAAYLAAHQDRPDQIKTGLSSGKLAEGMKEEEVRLCWGKPNKVVTGGVSGVQTTSWGYYENQEVAHSVGMSVRANVLVKEVQFTNGVVRAWREISLPR